MIKRLVLELDEKEHQKFKEKAVRLRKSMRKIMREFIEKFLGEK